MRMRFERGTPAAAKREVRKWERRTREVRVRRKERTKPSWYLLGMKKGNPKNHTI